jgi:hypothetical protein
LGLHMTTADNKRRSPVTKTVHAATVLTDALAAAGWVEADQALAEAIVEFGRLERALAACEISGPTRARAKTALAQTRQALARASRRRGLIRLGEVGAITAFVSGQHEFARPPLTAPSHVEIVAEGVMRGADVLIPALVKPARAVRKRPRV